MAIGFREVQLRLAGLSPGPVLAATIDQLLLELAGEMRARYPKCPEGVPEHCAKVTVAQAIRMSRQWAGGGIGMGGLSGEPPAMATEDELIAADKLDRDQGLDEE